jgi:25S rRNA (uracil2843-N3)-methyltransferase
MPAPQKHHARNQQSSKTKKPLRNVKKAPTESTAVEDRELSDIPLELQQVVLDLFKSSFPDVFDDDLPEKLQEVKTHLFNRDFLGAFGRDELLEAYAVRWSPSRTLAYLSILHGVIGTTLKSKDFKLASTTIASKSLDICCVGGGAGAELMSFAALLQLLLTRANATAVAKEKDSGDDNLLKEDVDTSSPSKEDANLKFSLLLMDIAEWGSVNKALYGSLTTPPKLSSYASAAVKAANRPFVSHQSLSQALYVTDILTINPEYLERMLSSHIKLVTIFFTLNELYTTSRAQTQAFLLKLTQSLQPGALLIVVDSAGSYSTVELNGAEKKYPMHWLLDHTLLKVAATASIGAGEANGPSEMKEKRGREQEYPRWEKLREEESTWFRLPEGLKYPLELEDMRYQLHLYRRLEQQ